MKEKKEIANCASNRAVALQEETKEEKRVRAGDAPVSMGHKNCSSPFFFLSPLAPLYMPRQGQRDTLAFLLPRARGIGHRREQPRKNLQRVGPEKAANEAPSPNL